MANASRDQNRVPTLLGVSNADGVTAVVIWANPITHALFVEPAGGTGTVTTVSVVSANGFAGTVANATSTPAITLTTTVTGLLKGNGTAISAATADVDYLTPGTAASTYLTQVNAASTYVPYTGATGDVTLGVHKLTAQNESITQFMEFTGIVDPSPPAAGFDRLYSQLGVDGLARLTTISAAGFPLTVHRDMVQRVFNPSGSTITKGSAVYVIGQSSGTPSVALSKADVLATCDVTGIMLADALAGGFSTMQREGLVQNINTNAFTAGDSIWLSDSVAGGLQNTAPTKPSIVVPIGTVMTKSATTGSMFIDIVNNPPVSLVSLTDVVIASPTVDQFLRYNGANWVNGPGASTSAGPGIVFYNSTPVINTRSSPGGISQDGTAGNGIKINSLSKTPITSVTATVTISHASPAVVTWTNHGLPIDAPVVFTTTGTLPAPLVAGTTYFIIAANYGANSFEISATVAGAAINTTTDGTGVHTGTATELTAVGLAQNDTRAFAAWLYDTALGRTTIDAGVWDFDTYLGINNNTGNTTLTRVIYQVVPASSGTVTTSGVGANTRVATITSSQFTGTYFNPNATNTVASYLQTPSGIFQITSSGTVNTANITVPTGYSNENAVAFKIWNKLLSSTTGDISAITPNYALMSFSVTAPAFTVATTDKLGAISFITTDQASRTLTLTFNGTTHNTRFTTPLTTLHNNLPGLQGGTSNEFYHLTAAEYTATATTGSGNFARLTSPQFTTPNIGSATGSVSGNSGTTTAANGLATATTTVAISAAAAPNNGDVLTASSSTAAAWAAPAATVTKATAAELNAGTDDAKFATALGLAGYLGWQAIGATLTYSSADAPTYVCTTSVDLTGLIGLGMRIKLTHAAAVKYFIVTAIDASTITLYGGTDYTLAATAITLPFFSTHKAPFGFPVNPSKWAVIVKPTTSFYQASPTQNTWYNITDCVITVPIGSWKIWYHIEVGGEAQVASTAGVNYWTTLSTANNSESDVDFTVQTSYTVSATNNNYANWHLHEKYLILASKTVYYLNIKTSRASQFSIFGNDDVHPAVLKAECMYL